LLKEIAQNDTELSSAGVPAGILRAQLTPRATAADESQ